MKTVMRMKDLKAKDGFPNNINRKHTVVVQIRHNPFLSPVVLYTAKKLNYPSWDTLPDALNRKYSPGLYIIVPDV